MANYEALKADIDEHHNLPVNTERLTGIKSAGKSIKVQNDDILLKFQVKLKTKKIQLTLLYSIQQVSMLARYRALLVSINKVVIDNKKYSKII